MRQYLERENVTGCFKSEADAAPWIEEKRRQGYMLGALYKHPCPWTNRLPWQVEASRDVEVEATP